MGTSTASLARRRAIVDKIVIVVTKIDCSFIPVRFFLTLFVYQVTKTHNKITVVIPIFYFFLHK